MNRLIVIEEKEKGWDIYMRNVNTGEPVKIKMTFGGEIPIRRNFDTYKEAEAYAYGMLAGISFYTDEIVSHGLVYERIND